MISPAALFLLSAGLAASVGPAPSDSSRTVYPWSAPTSWDVDLAPRDEPGPRMVMTGRVFGLDSLPAPGVKLYVYHADGKGWYARKKGQWNRIAGVLRTDERGEYRIRSILPGQYENGGAHIHFEVWDGDRPVRATFASLYVAPGVPPVPIWKSTSAASREWTPRMAIVDLDSSGVYRSSHNLWMSAMSAVMRAPPRGAEPIDVGATYDSLARAFRKQLESGRSK